MDIMTNTTYVSCVAEVVAEKCAVVLSTKHFMSILSDGSQARKAKSVEEMAMVRFERNGLPCYIMASLLEMSDLGGTFFFLFFILLKKRS